MRLVLPSTKYKKSYLTAEQESYRAKEVNTKELQHYKFQFKHFSQFLKNLQNERKGVGLIKGRVPQTRYWLIDKGQYIGSISIRHKLNTKLKKQGGNIGYRIRPSKRKRGYGKEILRLGLLKTQKLGINKVYIDCDQENIISQKIIEANGGVLRDIIKIKGHLPRVRRYYIMLG